MRKNHWGSKTSISVGHEHINFIHTFNNLNEFYTHIQIVEKLISNLYNNK